MKNLLLLLMMALCATLTYAEQQLQQEINQYIRPPLEEHDISLQIQQLEKEWAKTEKEADFWRGARFYNDEKKERYRKRQLRYWAGKSVVIKNKITKLKQNRSYYQHKKYGKKRFYYKK